MNVSPFAISHKANEGIQILKCVKTSPKYLHNTVKKVLKYGIERELQRPDARSEIRQHKPD